MRIKEAPKKDLQSLDSGVGGDDDADDSDMGCDCDILRWWESQKPRKRTRNLSKLRSRSHQHISWSGAAQGAAGRRWRGDTDIIIIFFYFLFFIFDNEDIQIIKPRYHFSVSMLENIWKINIHTKWKSLSIGISGFFSQILLGPRCWRPLKF